MEITFLGDIGKAFVPNRFRANLRRYFLKAGITEVPYNLFGGIFYLSLIITFIIYFWKVFPLTSTLDITLSLSQSNLSNFLKVLSYAAATWFVLPILFTFLFAFAIYYYLEIRIYNRTKRMEEVLPDFLRFVSENLKGGMSFEKALWSSIKPEFDVLASEVRLSAKKVMTGQDVEEALTEFTTKYDSPILSRAFNLIIEGMKGGGRIADLIDKIIEDIEEMKELKREMRTTNLSYIIFITFVVLIVTPALFTLSFQFLMVLKGISAKIGNLPTVSIGMPISFGKVSIDSEVFKRFSIYALAIISGFSAIIVSIISKGDIKGGVKYIPIYIAGSIIAYLVFMVAMSGFFSSMF